MTTRATSIAANVSVRKVSKTARAEVFRFLLGRGGLGATLAEISEGLAMPLQTVCARRHELGVKGLVTDSGARRPTPSGRSATVWVIPEHVAAAARKRLA